MTDDTAPATPTSPQRVQRRRSRGWRMPPNTVYVGRPGRWGNPFRAAEPTPEGRAEAVAQYRAWLAGRPDLLGAARRELAGRDLACWCPVGQPCHADILLAHLTASDGEPSHGR